MIGQLTTMMAHYIHSIIEHCVVGLQKNLQHEEVPSTMCVCVGQWAGNGYTQTNIHWSFQYIGEYIGSATYDST